MGLAQLIPQQFDNGYLSTSKLEQRILVFNYKALAIFIVHVVSVEIKC